MNVSVRKLRSPLLTCLIGLPIATSAPTRGLRCRYSCGRSKRKNWLFAIIFRCISFFFFFFPVEKPFRSNGPIGEMADWRRFARVTIIYYIGYDRAPPKIKPDIVYLQHALYADRSISFIFFTFRLKLPTHNVFFIHIFLLPFVNHHTHCRFTCR